METSSQDDSEKVAVLGLGEAGSVLASDLVRWGDEVHGYDPARAPMVGGVEAHATPESAVAGCGLVLAVTPASQALALLQRIVQSLDDGVLYADLSTGPPSLKKELAEIAAGQGLSFVDVGLMYPIPGRGLAAPALASGAGAGRYADLINARGGRVEVVGERAGEAAARKLRGVTGVVTTETFVYLRIVKQTSRWWSQTAEVAEAG